MRNASVLLHLALGRLIRHGTLRVRYPNGTLRQYRGEPGPEAGVHIVTVRALRGLTFNPALAFGEGYMDDEIRPEGCTLPELLELLVVNLMRAGPHPAERILEGLRKAWRRFDQLNTMARARRNVAHHYDLNGRLYALFLDRDLQYSCAYFPTGGESLDEAQVAKTRHIAAKLKLDRPGLEVLDIGSGWGGLAIALARDWGARVTGITLSEEQLAVSRRRADEAGLAGQVRFELMDYRAWSRPVDRIVSVGMFEHVGVGHFRKFFDAVRDALHPDGVALIHAIGRRTGPASLNPWMNKYIFPGSYAAALSEVLAAAEAADLWVTDIEILRLHYAMTLREWRSRFMANRGAIQAMYDERFCRMFEYYFTSLELGFRLTECMVWQMQLTRNIDALPITRTYMWEAERAAQAPSSPGQPPFRNPTPRSASYTSSSSPHRTARPA